MKENLDNINVIVGKNDERSVTIVKGGKPSHNPSRIIHTPEIVVRYFSDEDMERLREIHISLPAKAQSAKLHTILGKYVHYVVGKKGKK